MVYHPCFLNVWYITLDKALFLSVKCLSSVLLCVCKLFFLTFVIFSLEVGTNMLEYLRQAEKQLKYK